MIFREQNWFSISKIDSPWANLILHEQIFSLSNFCGLWAIYFADISSKIIALADPVLSQPDMKREMVSPLASWSSFEPARHETGNGFSSGWRVYFFTIYHVLPDHSWRTRRFYSSTVFTTKLVFVYFLFSLSTYLYNPEMSVVGWCLCDLPCPNIELTYIPLGSHFDFSFNLFEAVRNYIEAEECNHVCLHFSIKRNASQQSNLDVISILG